MNSRDPRSPEYRHFLTPEEVGERFGLSTSQVESVADHLRRNGFTITLEAKNHLVILADGMVADVQVMRGDEPFVSAAVKTVKAWKYQPARYKGQPITVYRIIQIPFKLTA